ncbi:MAG: PEP-CTERM sorting domain-containing protein, partial [Gammaproteobacteria bacterium]
VQAEAGDDGVGSNPSSRRGDEVVSGSVPVSDRKRALGSSPGVACRRVEGVERSISQVGRKSASGDVHWNKLSWFGVSGYSMGGFFFVTDVNGALAAGTINVSINGGPFQQSAEFLVTGSATNFFGWVSTNGTQISTFQVVTGGSQQWPTVNNLVLAQAAPVPVPGSLGLLSVGLLGTFSARRRARREV